MIVLRGCLFYKRALKGGKGEKGKKGKKGTKGKKDAKGEKGGKGGKGKKGTKGKKGILLLPCIVSLPLFVVFESNNVTAKRNGDLTAAIIFYGFT